MILDKGRFRRDPDGVMRDVLGPEIVDESSEVGRRGRRGLGLISTTSTSCSDLR